MRPGAAPGRHLGHSAPRRKPGRHTMSEMGQGCPSRSQSSPLPGGGGTSVAILFSSPNGILLSYSFLTLFSSSPLPYLLLFEPCSHNPQSPFFSFSCPFKEKKYLSRQQKVMTPNHQDFLLLPGRPFCQPLHTQCWRLHLLDKTSAS